MSDKCHRIGLPSTDSGSLLDMCYQAHVITFIGAGGKTTCVRTVSDEIYRSGSPVIASTTTKVLPEPTPGRWQDPLAWPGTAVEYPCFWYAGLTEGEGKWWGPAPQVIDQAVAADRQAATQGVARRFWVIEGDGAKGKKLKFWQAHEPQIPLSTECAVLVVHGGLWGKPLQAEDVHRPEVFPELIDEIWHAGTVWTYLLNSPAFQRTYSQMAWVLFFNESEFSAAEFPGLGELRRYQPDMKALKSCPAHLRLAQGNAKEGKALWFDLW